MYRNIVMLTLAAFALSACGAGTASSTGNPVTVITTTTFLADITRNIAGERLQIESLLPTGADPHSYQPSPQDAAKIEKSKLIITNGAGYEHFLGPLLENAQGERQVVEASAGLKSRSEAPDPHFWLDPNNVIIYVENIRSALTYFDPAGEAVYKSNADAYVAKLKDLDIWVEGEVAQIPAPKRLLVTNHESLGYFADHYGFTVIGAVVPGVSSDAAPSAQQMASLIDQIKSSGARAIFLDAPDNPTLAKQIASETGVKVITDLHLESLTDGPPAGTYIDMMKHNVMQIVNALK